MARDANTGNKDTASRSSGRVIVSISADVAATLDKLIASTAKALRETTGVAVELTKPQMVESLITSAAADVAERGKATTATPDAA